MTFLIIVTVVSLVIALVMSVIAWRAAGEERRRSEARVAGLATDIHSGDFDLRESPDFDLREPIAETPAMASDGLFGVGQPVDQGGRRFAIVGGVAVLVFGLAAVILMLSSGGSHTASASQARGTEVIDTPSAVENTSNAARAGSALPLELVALGHDRDGDRLTVRGIVRNPPSGAAIDKLTAVVFMFDRDGNFLGSGRATVESALGPGGESTFLVTVPGASSVGRYRVSFRTDDRVVPHVDRREHALARS